MDTWSVIFSLFFSQNCGVWFYTITLGRGRLRKFACTPSSGYMAWPEGKMDTCPSLPCSDMWLKAATWCNALKTKQTNKQNKQTKHFYTCHMYCFSGEKILKLLTRVIHNLGSHYVLLICTTKCIYFVISIEFISQFSASYLIATF